MAMTRTAKGTAKAKADGTSLTVASVAMTAGDALVVGIGWEDTPPKMGSVFWGGRRLREKAYRRNSTTGICVGIYVAREVNKTATHDVVATWRKTVGKRAMFVTSIAEPGKLGLFPDGESGKAETTDTAAPATGQTAALHSATSFAIAAFVSEGPSSDAAGTAQIEDNDSWQTANSGQRDGTVGAPPISNLTIQETWLELTTKPSTRARLQSATSRQWVSAVHTLGKTPWCKCHNSRVVRPDDDVDTYWLCEASNLTGDRENCDVVEADLSWL